MSTEVQFGWIYDSLDVNKRKVVGRYIMWDVATGAAYCEKCCGEIFDPNLRPSLDDRLPWQCPPTRCANCKEVLEK